MERARRKKIRLMIVDDEPLVLSSICRVLNLQPDMEIVALASGGTEAVNLAAKTKPDVVLMDVVMKPMNGVEATTKILSIDPVIKILGFSGHKTVDSVGGIIQAGAIGYVLKGGPVHDLVKSIRTVANNEKFIGPGLGEVVVDVIQRSATENPDLLASLTEREWEVLRFIGDGLKNKEIAERLNLSVKTIEAHRAVIRLKLKAKSTSDLIRIVQSDREKSSRLHETH